MFSYKLFLIDITIAVTLGVIIISLTILVAFCYMVFSPNTIFFADVLKTAKTGDLILFSSDNQELRWSSLNQWSHVGFILENPFDKENPLFIESDIPLTERGRTDLLSGTLDKNGVKMIYLKDKLEGYKGIMAYRKLQYKGKDVKPLEFFQSKISFGALGTYIYDNYNSKKYQNSGIFWLKQFIRLRKMNPFANIEGKKKTDKIFCSELVMELYRYLGVASPRIKKLHNVFPKHLSSTSFYNILSPNWKLKKERLVKFTK